MNIEGTGRNVGGASRGPSIQHYAGEVGRWSRANPRLSRVVWIAVGLAILGLVIWAIYPKPQQNRRFNNGPQPVGVSTAKLGDIQVTLNALGTVTPLATASVHPQVSGILTKLDYTEGQMVKKGDLLAEIDPKPYQAALDVSRGQLARDQATLANDRVIAKDQEGLAAANATSKEAVDTAESAVRSESGIVQTDQGNVETAQINLGYTRIVAPVDGRAGLHQTDVGNFVSAGTATTIVVITEMQPMSVVFAVPEDNVDAVMTQVNGGQQLSVDAYDRSQTTKITSGTLATVDNEIDPTTGTFKLRALFDNSDGKLFPNEFVNVRLLVNTLHNQTVIPVSAIQHGADGTYVFVVGPDKVANERTVTLGTQDVDQVAILKGLAPGDVVVTDGADRLRDGADVTIPNAGSQPIATPSGAAPAATAARGAAAQAAFAKACGDDIKKFCGSAAAGRAQRQCVAQHRSDLSATCRTALTRGGRGGFGGGGGRGGGGGGFGGAP